MSPAQQPSRRQLPPSALDALEPGWRDWLIENKQRGCTDAALLQAMVEKDIDADLAAQALRALMPRPMFRPSSGWPPLNPSPPNSSGCKSWNRSWPSSARSANSPPRAARSNAAPASASRNF
ncbi:MAG: hypothetical protein HC824_02780 [Synechococcales cyanobacterium RM1_1_8]|nr:hypothetical protein [Synechococcales cyanobacterium RM1_1_8]